MKGWRSTPGTECQPTDCLDRASDQSGRLPRGIECEERCTTAPPCPERDKIRQQVLEDSEDTVPRLVDRLVDKQSGGA